MKKMKFSIRILSIILACMMVLCSCNVVTGTPSEEETTQHVHDFGSWKTVKKATETKNGLKERYCDCGEVESKKIPKLDSDDKNDDTTSDNGNVERPTSDNGNVEYPTENPGVNDNIYDMGYDGSHVTITFYHTMGSYLQDVLDMYISEFNQMYPNITIEHRNVGAYDDLRDQVKTELSVNEQPNIAYCYPDHVALYNLTGKVVPLNDFIYNHAFAETDYGYAEYVGLEDWQIDDFIPGFYNEGASFDDSGTMYMLPFLRSTDVLYYNKTFFDAYGLTVPATWEEMEVLCQYIKEIDPNAYPFAYDSEANWFITMCEQLGSPYTSVYDGNHILFNDSINRGFVTEFREWYEAGYFTTMQLCGSYTSSLFTSTSYYTPRCYMSIGSSAGALHQRPSDYSFEVGIAPVPQVDPYNPKAISQGPSLCIFDDGIDNMEEVASWLFVKFLVTNPELQADFSMASGYMPVISSAYNVSRYENFLAGADGYDNIAALAVQVGIEQSHAYFATPTFVGSSEAREQVGNLMVYCFMTSARDVDALISDAFEQAVKECNKYVYK